MKKKKTMTFKNCLTSAIIASIAILSCSVTVLAYEDIDITEYVWYLEEAEIDSWENEVGIFNLPEYDEELKRIHNFVYKQQFVDEKGNIFPITKNEPCYAGCSHSYTLGSASFHTKMIGTSNCIVKKYNAKKCSKCQNTVITTLITHTTYTDCPHS